MTNPDDKTVRELYASATVFDKTHLRHALNEAEFDSWLAAHDGRVELATIDAMETLLMEGLPDKMFWNRDVTRPALPIIQQHIEAVRIKAAAAGGEVKESGRK